MVDGSQHQSFADLQAYLSPIGRSLPGDGASPEATSDSTWETGYAISGFVSPLVDGPANPMLEGATREVGAVVLAGRAHQRLHESH